MKNTKKKYQFIKHFLTLGAVVAASGIISAIVTGCENQSSNWTYADIITLNDFHGNADEFDGNEQNMPEITALANEYSTLQNKDVANTGNKDTTYMLLNGDNAQGTAFSNISNPSGKSVYDLFRNFHIEYSSVGNHEFDWGQSYLSGVDSKGQYHETFKQMGAFKDFLACNIFEVADEGSNAHPTNLVNWVKPWAVTNINGLKVGLVGYTTYETYETTISSNLKGLAFADGRDTKHFNQYFPNEQKTGNQVLQKAINDCRNSDQHPDVVFLLAHAGGTWDYKKQKLTDDSEIVNLIKSTNGLDGVLSAHTHNLYVDHVNNKNGKEVVVAQGGKYGQSYTQTIVRFNKTHHELHNVEMSTHHLGTYNSETKKWVYPQKEEIVNYDQFAQGVNRQFEYWKEKNKPIINHPEFALTSDQLKDDKPYIPKRTNNSPFSPSGMFMVQAYNKVFVKETLDQVSASNYPEINAAKTTLKTKWSDFTGIDLSITNIGGVRDDLLASNPINTQKTANVNLGDLYRLQSFDNSTYIVKLKVKYVNQYLNNTAFLKYYTAKEIDPIFSLKYAIGYRGEQFLPSTKPTQKNYYALIDKNTHQPVNEDTVIYMSINEFYYLNGDNSEFKTWADDPSTGVEACALSQTFEGNTIFNDSRYVIIQAAKVVNNTNPAITYSGDNITPGFGFDPSSLAYKIS